MVTIDLRKVPIRAANEILRGYGSTHQDVEILNPDAGHYIGVGLISPIQVWVRGSAGYYCGGLCDGPRFFIEGNASWGVGDNLFLGSLVGNGNASAGAGEGRHGGRQAPGERMEGTTITGMVNMGMVNMGMVSFMAGYM